VRNADREHSIVVVTPDRDLGDQTPWPDMPAVRHIDDSVTVRYVNCGAAGALFAAYKQVLTERFDVVLLNSVWNWRFSLLPASLKLVGIMRTDCLVLMPRGELDPGALALKQRKKRVAQVFVRALYRATVDLGAFTSAVEEQALTEWIPGVPQVSVTNTPDALNEGYIPRGEQFRVLVLGRVHAKKGVFELLKASKYTKEPLLISIAGPVDDEAYYRKCLQLIAELPRSVEVKWLGTVRREAIEYLLWNTDLLAMLTAGENFGHVIAEAMQVGCPVLITDTTPWSQLVSEGGGTVIADRSDDKAIAGILDAWNTMDMNELTKRRDQARASFDVWQSTAPRDVLTMAGAWLSDQSSTSASEVL